MGRRRQPGRGALVWGLGAVVVALVATLAFVLLSMTAAPAVIRRVYKDAYVRSLRQQRSLTRITPVEGTSAAELDAIFAAMEAEALQDLIQEQIPRERLQTVRHAGMRYRGQSYEVAVPVPGLHGPPGPGALSERCGGGGRNQHGGDRVGRRTRQNGIFARHY